MYKIDNLIWDERYNKFNYPILAVSQSRQTLSGQIEHKSPRAVGREGQDMGNRVNGKTVINKPPIHHFMVPNAAAG